MDPKGIPKGTQNRLKSAKMLPGTLPERVWRRSLEKVASQSLPETSPYASRTINTMVFSLPRGYPQAPFGLHFGSILGAFWAPLAPKSRPGSEKDTSKKTSKNYSEKNASRSQNGAQKGSNPDQIQTIFGTFFPSWDPLAPKWPPGPISAPFSIEIQ